MSSADLKLTERRRMQKSRPQERRVHTPRSGRRGTIRYTSPLALYRSFEIPLALKISSAFIISESEKNRPRS